MPSLAQMSDRVQTLFTTTAEDAARTTGCVQRVRAFTGSQLVQTLVFGCLRTPAPSLTDLTQTAAALGVTISPQGLAARFTPHAAACLEQVLAAIVGQVVAADPVAIPLLQRFNGVYLLDTTTVALPTVLAARWPGCGNGAAPTAATLKLGVRCEVTTGALLGPLLEAGRTHDRATAIAGAPLPPDALRIADLGFWKLDDLQALSATGRCWLSRLRAQTALYDTAGVRQQVGTLLAAQETPAVDLPVSLGVEHRLPARLLACRVPAEVAARRRRRVRREAKRRG